MPIKTGSEKGPSKNKMVATKYSGVYLCGSRYMCNSQTPPKRPCELPTPWVAQNHGIWAGQYQPWCIVHATRLRLCYVVSTNVGALSDTHRSVLQRLGQSKFGWHRGGSGRRVRRRCWALGGWGAGMPAGGGAGPRYGYYAASKAPSGGCAAPILVTQLCWFCTC